MVLERGNDGIQMVEDCTDANGYCWASNFCPCDKGQVDSLKRYDLEHSTVAAIFEVVLFGGSSPLEYELDYRYLEVELVNFMT